MNTGPEVRNIVLVHGGFVDGSGWQGVYDHLTADGFRVAVVQNPTLSLAGDVAATHQVLGRLARHPLLGLVAGSDKAIPPALERYFYRRASAQDVVEVPGASHCVMVSHPATAAGLIESAASATNWGR